MIIREHAGTLASHSTSGARSRRNASALREARIRDGEDDDDDGIDMDEEEEVEPR
jgi:hypothetical protein